jgi:hypothetical protein
VRRCPFSAGAAAFGVALALASRARAADTESRAFELWFEGAYAATPVLVDPLGSLRIRFRGDPLPHVRIGAHLGTGLACDEPCRASIGWALEVPMGGDISYVFFGTGWSVEFGAGYEWIPAIPLEGGTLYMEQGPRAAVRVILPHRQGAALAVGFVVQLRWVSPSSAFDERSSTVVGPAIGIAF